MSGGSYNYLYLKDDAGLKNNPDLEDMATRLEGLGYPNLAYETRHLSNRRIVIVWEAIEKFDSYDWGWHQVEQAIISYNNPPAISAWFRGEDA